MTTSDLKWAALGDLQIPYHDPRAVELWFKVMKWWKPAAIDIVGDIDDQLEYSSFSDGTTDEFFSKMNGLAKENAKAMLEYSKAVEKAGGIIEDGLGNQINSVIEEPLLHDLNPMPFVKANAAGAKEFYTAVRRQHKNADIHASLGNHDIRVFKYMDKKAPEYIDQITPNALWGLDDLGISYRYYDLPPMERFGGIHVHHGATTTTTGLAVRTDIETYNISLIRGHDHRGGVVYKTYPMTNNKLVGMGTGHLCDPSAYGLSYTINPAWELGFGIVHVSEGVAHPQFIPIRDYTCIVDGKVFKN